MAKMNLDLTNVSTASNIAVLDTGMYRVGITGAEIAKTASGGHMLNVTMTVKEGPNEGKSIMNRMNIVNKNPDTVKWALKDLKTVMTIAGHANPNHLADSDELLSLNDFNVSLEKKGQVKDGQPVCNDKGEQYMENKYNGFFKASATPAAKTENTPDATTTQGTKAEPATETKKETPTETAPQGEFPWS